VTALCSRTCKHGVCPPQLRVGDAVALPLGELLELFARELEVFAGAPAKGEGARGVRGEGWRETA
jgi:hypothetical protein